MMVLQLRSSTLGLGVRLLAFLSVYAALFLGCTSAPPRPPGGIAPGDYDYLSQRMSYEIEQAIDDRNLAAVAIAVVDGDKVVFQQGFGRPDPDQPRPTTIDTVFRVGSVSKLFTGIAIMQLVEAGSVDLEAPLTTYLPEFTLLPPSAQNVEAADWKLDDITVRSVLTHHAGIPGDVLKQYISETPRDYRTFPALLQTLHASHPVGLVQSYSNIGISLLGLVIERVSKQDFAAYIREHILTPCGMPDAAWVLSDKLRDNYAPPFGDGEVKKHYDFAVVPAGTLYASVAEMAQFAKMLLANGVAPGGVVLPRARLEEMWTRQNTSIALDLDHKMGLSFFIDVLPVEGSQRALHHSGGTLYHRATFLVLPHEKIATIVLSNSSTSKTDSLAQQAAEIALDTKLGLAFSEKEFVPPPSASPPAPAVLESRVGYWDTALGLIQIKRDGDDLVFKAFDTTFELQPTEGQTWTVVAKIFGFIPFQPDALRKIVLKFEEVGAREVLVALHPKTGARQLAGSRITPVPVPDVWKARHGTWIAADAQGDAVLFRALKLGMVGEQQALFLLPEKEGDPVAASALEAVTDTSAVILGLGQAKGDWVEAGIYDGQPALWFSGYRLKRQSP